MTTAAQLTQFFSLGTHPVGVISGVKSGLTQDYVRATGSALSTLDTFAGLIKRVPGLGLTGYVLNLSKDIQDAYDEFHEKGFISDKTVCSLASGMMGVLGLVTAPEIALAACLAGAALGVMALLQPNDKDHAAYDALRDAAVGLAGAIQDTVKAFPDAFNKFLDQLKHGVDDAIDAIKDQFGAVKAIRVDPLILDLDGDGIVNTTGLKAGTYFDYDGNGFAELTGWVGQGDGLLVWDRNGNGVIDDGTELFGDNTLLANGMRAASSFAV